MIAMTSHLFRRLLPLALAYLAPLCFAQQPLRVAVVGLEHGHIGGFFQQFPKQQDVELVGVADADASLRDRYEQQFHIDHKLFFADPEAMVAATHPQALLVYTSVGEHRKVIEFAAAHNLAVMVEKPLTISVEDAVAIRKAAREHHIQVLVNYETTWYSANRAIYDLLQQGKLGDIRKVIVRDGHQGPAEIHVQPEFLKWLTDPALNGAGSLYDFGCYGADVMTWFMHGETPISVTAVAQTDKPDIYSRVDDDATIIVRYPRAQAVLLPSWNWTFGIKNMEVYGNKGYAFALNGGKDVLDRFSQRDPDNTFTAPPLEAPNDSSLHYLAAVLRGQLEPKGDLNSLDTNMIVVQILDAARHSAATGKTILLQPLPQ
jgi:glucose-fructose oxidoreductase